TLMLGYIVDLPAWAYLGVWIGLQIVWAVLYGSIGEGGIAWWAHIGGFFAGLSMAFLARKMSET
ncbi:MAG: rhomboid family intramembrane serine protease, partial [Bdellovibrionales bacterium]|nr:rhomboid family intramembrane serine protease [Bdellovibrionales bacterium]